MPKVKGRIKEDFSPVIAAGILKDGRLSLGKGDLELLVDTGFNGDISAPSEILNGLDLKYWGAVPIQLADGKVTTQDLWSGTVVLGGLENEALFSEGEFLLGMDLAAELFSYLLIDFQNNTLTLE